MCLSLKAYKASGQISFNHCRFKNQTNIHHIQYKKINKNIVRRVSHLFYDVKRLISCTASRCCDTALIRDLKWHIADVISIIWMFHFGQNHLESHSAHSYRSFLSVSTHLFSILRSLLQACCDLPLLRVQNRELNGLFPPPFTTNPPSSIQALTHRIL